MMESLHKLARDKVNWLVWRGKINQIVHTYHERIEDPVQYSCFMRQDGRIFLEQRRRDHWKVFIYNFRNVSNNAGDLIWRDPCYERIHSINSYIHSNIAVPPRYLYSAGKSRKRDRFVDN